MEKVCPFFSCALVLFSPQTVWAQNEKYEVCLIYVGKRILIKKKKKKNQKVTYYLTTSYHACWEKVNPRRKENHDTTVPQEYFEYFQERHVSSLNAKLKLKSCILSPGLHGTRLLLALHYTSNLLWLRQRLSCGGHIFTQVTKTEHRKLCKLVHCVTSKQRMHPTLPALLPAQPLQVKSASVTSPNTNGRKPHVPATYSELMHF